MYTMKFYDEHGDTLGTVTNLTIDEVNTIYRGCRSILKWDGNSLGYNLNMPTVWDEETKERLPGY